MVSTKYEFQAVPGHAIGRRSVGFLVEDGNPALNAKAVFAGLKIDQERDVRKKFDYWLAEGKHDGWFHGWRTDEDVKYCFTFKWAEKRLNHRFYGYLWNPQPKTNPRFHICVLMFHESKNDESTNRTILLRCMALRGYATVQLAINFVFPDEKPTEKGRIQ